VILFNPSGEITETTISNIAFRFSGDPSTPYTTPRTSCGILEGVQRAELLEKGEIVEGVVRVDEVKQAIEVHFLSFLFPRPL
jgi:4-amino-4-deoxychorismate lyase